MNKKLLLLAGVGFVLSAAAVIIFLRLTTATITISSDPQADIYVRQGEEDFAHIGVSEAIFETRSLKTVIIEARLEDNASQKSVEPVRRDNIHVELQIEPVAEAKFLANGPLIYPHVEGRFVYGINPNTNGLTARLIGGDDPGVRPPALPNLPFLKQIIWFNSREFIYVTLGQGTRVAGTVIADDHIISEMTFPYIQAAASPKKDAIALLASDGVFLAGGANISDVTQLAPTADNSSPFIFVDEKHIYFVSLIFEEAIGEDDQPAGKESRLLVFSHQGQQLHDLPLPTKEDIYRVVGVDESTLAVLSAEGMSFIDTDSGEVRQQAFSFGSVEDLLMFNGRMLLLGATGLWEYDGSSGSYRKVARYPEGEEYVPKSLAIINDALYFSTSIKKEELLKESTNARSAIYRIDL